MSPVTGFSFTGEPPLAEAFAHLVEEYLASLPFSLGFQDVAGELADLPAAYGPPGGAAFLAIEGERSVGCVAIRPLGAGVAELKRMYVVPEARKRGHGRALCEAAIAQARRLGYRRLRLDTVAEMEAAAHIYRALGFRPIAPYRENPLETARFYELDLTSLPAPTERS